MPAMLLRIHSPSLPLAHYDCSSPPSFFSSFSNPVSYRNPSNKDCILVFFSISKCSSCSPLRLGPTHRRIGCRFLQTKQFLWSCRAFTGNWSSVPDPDGDDDSDLYLQASLLAPETIKHYNLWKQGFIEETKWHSASHKYPFSPNTRGVDINAGSISDAFLRRFQSPTVFLKIACDGELLLPIIVGEFTIIKIIDAISGDQQEECPDEFQFVKNVVETFGYEVKMVRITDRVVNTYFARIYLRKIADNSSFIVDSRPSDALNVAERFKAPIFVNKEIVVKDAIQIVYGMWRARSTRTVYDVSLDSAPDGPDPLFEELDLVQKMNMAVLEERFDDAAMWRDKLAKLRMPRHEL